MENSTKNWTVMIYMAGDNNLSADMSYAMEEIRKVALENRDTVNLFVYYDGNSPAIPTLYCDYSSTADDKIFFRSGRIKKRFDRRHKRPSEPPQNEDSAKMYSVLNFVDWCVNLVEHDGGAGRKAENYALIFSGHTAGFHDVALFRDESAAYHMSMRKLNWLLKRITQSPDELEGGGSPTTRPERNPGGRTGGEGTRPDPVVIGKKLAVLGFDSCAMGMLEVGYEFQPYAETLVVSEGNVPSAGWSYAGILGRIARGNPDPRAAARGVVEEFITKQDRYTISGSTVDMAAWDLSKLPGVDEPLADLVENLSACFDGPGEPLYRAMQRTLLYAHWRCQTYMFDQNVDLVDFCSILKSEVECMLSELMEVPRQLETIPKKCDRVIAALREAVILGGFSGGTYQYSNGISMFFPWSASGYRSASRGYNKLQFVSEGKAGRKWDAFLERYLNDISMRPGKTPTGKLPANAGVVYSPFVYRTEKLARSTSANEKRFSGSPLGASAHDGNGMGAKTPDDPKTRTPDDPKTRTPDDPKTRTPDDPKTRTPDDPKTRMFGSLSSYFDQLFVFKNIETEWNISGFTKPIAGADSTRHAGKKKGEEGEDVLNFT